MDSNCVVEPPAPAPPKISRNPVVAVLLLPTAAVIASLVVRLVFLYLTHHHADLPHQRYVTWGLEALMVGKSLADGFGFANTFPHYPYVTAWLAPVYPWILSLGRLLFRLDDHGTELFAQILNIILSSLTAYPIYYLGKKVYGSGTGLGAAWLWAFSPVAILMPIEWIWDQSLAALLLALLLSFTYWIRESATPYHWAGYGLLWGAAALTNPTLCILLPFLLLWLWFQRAKNPAISAALLARAVLFFVLAVLPWTMRNYFEFGSLFFVKSNFGLELWLGNNTAVGPGQVYSLAYHPEFNYREYKLLLMTGEPIYNKLKQRDAIAFIRANPYTFRQLCRRRFVDTWTGVFDTLEDTFVRPAGIRAEYVWSVAILSAFSFAGLLLSFFTSPRESFPLTLCVLLFPIPYYITHSSLRYRHPIDPILTILAVFAVARMGSLFRRRQVSTTGTP
jgi:4-amino-4-deoxy-L-arabinose transferase-like glycosyltransferase